jgi:hypothetical protein
MADKPDKPDKPLLTSSAGEYRPDKVVLKPDKLLWIGADKVVLKPDKLLSIGVPPVQLRGVRQEPNKLLLFTTEILPKAVLGLTAALGLAGSLLVLMVSLPQTTLTRIGYVVFTLVVGTLLYCFRCRWIGVYGIIEIAVGIGSAIWAAFKYNYGDDNTVTLLYAEIVALYIIVRGYDNLFKAIEKNPKYTRRARVAGGSALQHASHAHRLIRPP